MQWTCEMKESGHHHTHRKHKEKYIENKRTMVVKEDMEKGENSVQEEITEPFLQQQKKNVAGEEDGFGDENHTQKSSKRQVWMVYLTTFVAVCGAFEVGACSGYTSPTQTAIREDLDLSVAEYSVFGSILTFGAMVGGITSGTLADFIGRKGAMGVSCSLCVAGWLAIYFAKEALALDIGRTATGYGMGVLSYVVPVYVAEIAPKNIRGALTTINQIMLGTGVLVSYIVGTLITWRNLALTGLLPCGVMLLGLFFIPESPRWLVERGCHKEFKVALQRLRGKDADISDEASEIQDYIESLQRLEKAKFLDLFQKRYLHSVTASVGLMAFQQFGGVNAVCFYASTIFESAGVSSSVGTITYASLQVAISAICATIIDRAGRKPLLLVAASGMVLGCMIAGISFYLKVQELSLKSVPILAVTGILVFGGSYAVGMGAIPWIIMSEIFPINFKGTAGSLATLVNWSGAWVISYSFNFLMAWSSYGTFILYAAINALAILFVAKVVPETKGKTLEQIQATITTENQSGEDHNF